MSDITAEQKVELIRSIREQNNKNRSNLKSREHILYGSAYDAYSAYSEADAEGQTQDHTSFMGIRILAGIVLFALFIILDYTQNSFFSFNADKIYTVVTENYIANSFDFIEEITYTLSNAE